MQRAAAGSFRFQCPDAAVAGCFVQADDSRASVARPSADADGGADVAEHMREMALFEARLPYAWSPLPSRIEFERALREIVVPIPPLAGAGTVATEGEVLVAQQASDVAAAGVGPQAA